MAKIIGNTVGIPNPQSDWLQDDPSKADYIRNKPTNLATKEELQSVIDGETMVENANNADWAQNAKLAEKAMNDSRGYPITEYYATKEEVGKIIDGTTRVGNANSANSSQFANEAGIAYRDINGNSIDDHYATKEELDNVGIALDDVINGGVEVKKANYATSAGKAAQATYANEASNAYQAIVDGNGNDITSTYATKEEVGDIETALDEIIAIENTLKGGGSV